MVFIWNPFLYGRCIVELKNDPNHYKKFKDEKNFKYKYGYSSISFLQDFEKFMTEKLNFEALKSKSKSKSLTLKKNFDNMSLYIDILNCELDDWLYPDILILKIKFKNRYISKSKTYAIIREYSIDKAKYILNHVLNNKLNIKDEYILLLISINNTFPKDSEYYLIGNINKIYNKNTKEEYLIKSKEPIKILKDKYLQLNKKIIDGLSWLFPLSSYSELHAPHHEKKEGFNLFNPVKSNNLCYITLPIEIFNGRIDIIKRRKLTEEINKILDFMSILICIIYGMSQICRETLSYIDKRLLNPLAYNLSGKYKEYVSMKKIDFVDYNSTLDIMNSALLYINNKDITPLCEIKEEIFSETLENYINLLYGGLNKTETKINNFIGLHDNIIVALIGFFTLLATIIGLMR